MAVGDTMQGKRVADVERPAVSHPILNAGEYRRTFYAGSWHWECCTPNELRGNLDAHQVTEHEDGTITVSPSILVETPGVADATWHGYLEQGVWREV